MKNLNISEDIDFELEEIIGKCVGILGIRGSGKSNTAGVIFEELLNHNYPLTVVDIDGEYFGLKEEYELLVIGEGENVDLNIEPEDAEQVAEISIRQSIPVVLDLSGFLKSDQRSMLKSYFTRLWNLAGKLRKPYMIGIEESHEYIPQGKKEELKEIITRIALRGRKRGLGAVILSQRSAKVEKDVLTQAGMLFLHRVIHEADMKVYNDLLPWKKSKVKKIVGSLQTGECVFLNEKSARKIYVRERSTFHAGFTPSLDTVETPQLKQVGEDILKAIEDAKKKGKRKKSKMEKLNEKVKELEKELKDKKEQVRELKDTARTLGYIKIDSESNRPKKQKISKAIIESLEIEGLLNKDENKKALKLISQTLNTLGQIGNTGLNLETDDENETKKEIDWKKRIDYTKEESENTDDYEKEKLKKEATEKEKNIQKIPSERTIDGYEKLPRPVKSQVDKIIDKAKRGDPIKQRILAFLISHRPHAYSIHQISAWMNIPVGLLLTNRPWELIEYGLIRVLGKATGVHYKSALKNFVEREFDIYQPDISAKERHFIIKKLEYELGQLPKKQKREKKNYIKFKRGGYRSKPESDINSDLVKTGG
mgnify:CR=1 FL=1